ncbi:ABC transporter substrate-binding protein [Ornithinimicrobium sp. F0845]|uniref:ABC transporter substrate-binding protein n=1 Tax=Ornithinimicrobium sp. F0845 TaxID=2926412 RepID=UPI001FF33009|nr:ABC transporter substrate-binding protein [Ornithinimicrobium sp. F0845]MCK0111838.1 ABC transporter substrate-binding protein [Ornithinimicrobium sp. F0845]
MTHRPTARRAAPVVLATLVFGLASCGVVSEVDDSEGQEARTGFPLTLTNCGAEVTLEAPPEQVLLLKSWPVIYLHELGVMDRVISRAGAYPDEYYDEETRSELADVPLLTDQLDPSGHLQISREVVLAQEPDLIFGEVENLDRTTLGSAGISVLEEPALCPTGGADAAPQFEDIYEQMEVYGAVFAVPGGGADQAAALRQRVEAIVETVPAGETRTAAVLYPTVGGGTTYAYGTRSMAHPQLTAAGFENVFADVDERVFEVSVEELVGRDPDVLVLLYSDGEPGPVKDAVTALPGADGITAIVEDEVLVQLFNFTEPPSPLAVDGLERIVDRFHP